MLERLYRMTGEVKNAETAAEHVSTLQDLPPEVVQAGSLFSDGDLSAAENILREYLLKAGHQVEALRLLAGLPPADLKISRGKGIGSHWITKRGITSGRLALRHHTGRQAHQRQRITAIEG